jgi:hypothetical protein
MNYHIYRSDTKIKNGCDHREVSKFHNIDAKELVSIMPMFGVGIEKGEVNLFPAWCDVANGVIGVAAYYAEDAFYLVVSTDNSDDDEIVITWFAQLHDKEMGLTVLETIGSLEVALQLAGCFEETDNYEIYLNKAHDLYRCHYVEER